CLPALRAALPGGLARVAPIDLFVHVHEAKAALLGMREQLVDAVKDVWPLAGGAVHLVVLHPGHPTVLGAVHTPDADADLHLLRIGRVDRDRVEAHTPEARHPLRAGRLIVEALHDGPRLAAVLALEERGRLGARPDHVRRLGVPRLDVPRLGEGPISSFWEGGVLRRLPRLAY